MILNPRSPQSDIRKLQLAGFSAIALAVGGFGSWAATTQITGAVIANGSIVVESNSKKVQHPSGGVVGEILVKEGAAVEAEQVLMRLDDTLTRASLGVIQSR
jgi:HlyD family secretion protein